MMGNGVRGWLAAYETSGMFSSPPKCGGNVDAVQLRLTPPLRRCFEPRPCPELLCLQPPPSLQVGKTDWGGQGSEG